MCSYNIVTPIFDEVCDFYGVLLSKLDKIKSRIIRKNCRSDQLGLLEFLPTQSLLNRDEGVKMWSYNTLTPIFSEVCDFYGVLLSNLVKIKSRIVRKNCRSDQLGLLEV